MTKEDDYPPPIVTPFPNQPPIIMCKIEKELGFWQNLIQNDSCYIFPYNWTLFLCVLYFLIFAFGVIGNIIVIFVLSYKRRMRRSITNIFILNLAVADLCVILFCLPSNLVITIYGPWIMENFLCKGISYVQGVSVFSSVFSLVSVSLDRCLAIRRPSGPSRDGLTKRQALLIVILIWAFGFILLSPWPIVFTVTIDPYDNLPYCTENWGNTTLEKLYVVLGNLILCFILPLMLIIILNRIIYRSMRDCRRGCCSPFVGEMQSRSRRRVLRMLYGLTSVFCFCWLPLYLLIAIVKLTDYHEEFFIVLIPISQLLGSFNSCLNPVLYAFYNKKFREALYSTLPSCLRCRRSSNSQRSDHFEHFELRVMHSSLERRSHAAQFETVGL